MPTMIGYDFGDVVLVPFPFTNQSASKKRPAVVVSSSRVHQDRPDVMLMAITSQTGTSDIGGIMIQAWKEGGLLKPSVVKPVITTLHRDLVIKKLGHFENRDQTALREYLHQILG